MNTQKVYVSQKAAALLLLAALFLLTGPAWAQQEPVPFQCTGEAYTVRATPGELFKIDQTLAPFDFIPIGGTLMGPFGANGAMVPIQANNLGYDIVNNLLWAVALPHPTQVAGPNFGLIQIDSTGAVFPVASNPDISTVFTRFLAGDISSDGSTMYLAQYPSGANLYIVDLTSATKDVTIQPLTGGPVNVADWAYNPVDGMLYGAEGKGPAASSGAGIYQLNPGSGAITLIGNPTGLPLANSGDGQYYGGAWFNAAGRLFVYRNSDHIYEIDLAGSTSVVADFDGDAGSSQFNDAAACALGTGTIDKFYTHTNNDWGLRCAEWEIIEEEEVCVEYRLPNINLDDDIFADPLDQNEDGFVLYGKYNKKKTVVTPGQYFAVSDIFVPSERDVWVEEDFSRCTDIGRVNPNKVPGGVQVVIIEENGDVYPIHGDLASGVGGSIVLDSGYALVHVENVPAGATLRVLVKFQPLNTVEIGAYCMNHEILYDGDPNGEPEGVEINRDSEILTVVPKE